MDVDNYWPTKVGEPYPAAAFRGRGGGGRPLPMHPAAAERLESREGTTFHKDDIMKRRKFDHEILLLQGGGALLAKLPPDLKADPDVRKLAPLCDNRDWTIINLNNRRPAHGGQFKDAEFSRSAVLARWAAGLDDIRFSTANLDWVQPAMVGEGVRIFHFPPVGLVAPERSSPAALRIADIPEGPEDKTPHDTVRTA